MSKICGYIRVSTHKQEQSGLSLEAQETKLRAWAAANHPDMPLHLFVDRAVSAFKQRLAERPEGFQMCAALEVDDIVIVASGDRMFRNAMDMRKQIEAWTALQIKFIIINWGGMLIDFSTPMGLMMGTLIGLMGELESMNRSDRVKAAYAAQRLRGIQQIPKRLNISNIGYKFVIGPTGKVIQEIDPEQIAQMREIMRLMKLGYNAHRIYVEFLRLRIKRPSYYTVCEKASSGALSTTWKMKYVDWTSHDIDSVYHRQTVVVKPGDKPLKKRLRGPVLPEYQQTESVGEGF